MGLFRAALWLCSIQVRVLSLQLSQPPRSIPLPFQPPFTMPGPASGLLLHPLGSLRAVRCHLQGMRDQFLQLAGKTYPKEKRI